MYAFEKKVVLNNEAIRELTCKMPCKLVIRKIAAGKKPYVKLTGSDKDQGVLKKLNVTQLNGKLTLTLFDPGMIDHVSSSTSWGFPNKRSFKITIKLISGEEITLCEKPTLVVCIPTMPLEIEEELHVEGIVTEDLLRDKQVLKSLYIDLHTHCSLRTEGELNLNKCDIKIAHHSNFQAKRITSSNLRLDLKHHSELRTDALIIQEGIISVEHHASLIVERLLSAEQKLILWLVHHAKCQANKMQASDLILDLKHHSKLRTDALSITKGEIGMQHHCRLTVREKLLAAQQLNLNVVFHSKATIEKLITKQLKSKEQFHSKIAIRQQSVS